MGGNLIQHVVEETHPVWIFAAAFAIRHTFTSICLFGVAFYVRVAVTFGELLTNLRQLRIVAVVAQPVMPYFRQA